MSKIGIARKKTCAMFGKQRIIAIEMKKYLRPQSAEVVSFFNTHADISIRKHQKHY